MKLNELTAQLAAGGCDQRLAQVYGSGPHDVGDARERLLTLLERYSTAFGDGDVGLYTAPGRTEMGGNHTDHQQGAVLAGSVTMDMIAAAGANGTNVCRILSEGFPEISVDLGNLEPNSQEFGTSESLVRGIARAITDRGYDVAGFNAVISSAVPGGSGLSSSAAYEILIGVILNHLTCGDGLSAAELAQIGQFSENNFFGKPSGLMDQMGCSLGGVAHLDFKDPGNPIIDPIPFDMEETGYALCIIDSGGDHADLTDDYTAIRNEMKDVAAYFGKDVLREVEPEDFWANFADARSATSDRAVLRATHFFEDHARVELQAEAIREGRFEDFLETVTASGISSQTQLENTYSPKKVLDQPVAVAISVAKHLLGGRGAVRVHGGGFAGTIQAYVPADAAQAFKEEIDKAIGADACHILRIRPIGGALITG
ncbi:MAG: galactokinase [Ancrocorticia sp.]|uniref:galactokinase n=1 Tax=Ancrocorticia sp. TaxID=2593684 RepID=UPI003F8DDD88